MRFTHRRSLARQTDTTAEFEPRNFLVTFLLACSFGPFGLRHFYLGNKRLGWIRLGLFVGGFIWTIVFILLRQPAVAFMGIMATIVAVVWAVIDLFYVYFKVRSDDQGKPLTLTLRDQKWARALFIVMIVMFTFSVILNVIGATMNRTTTPNNGSPYNTNYQLPGRS